MSHMKFRVRLSSGWTTVCRCLRPNDVICVVMFILLFLPWVGGCAVS